MSGDMLHPRFSSCLPAWRETGIFCAFFPQGSPGRKRAAVQAFRTNEAPQSQTFAAVRSNGRFAKAEERLRKKALVEEKGGKFLCVPEIPLCAVFPNTASPCTLPLLRAFAEGAEHPAFSACARGCLTALPRWACGGALCRDPPGAGKSLYSGTAFFFEPDTAHERFFRRRQGQASGMEKGISGKKTQHGRYSFF